MGDRWLLRRLSRGKKPQRVDVSVRVGREPDPEIDVRLGPLDVAARPDRPDDVALGDRRAGRDADRPQVDEGDRVAVRGPDRETQPLVRQPPDERGHARRRRANVRTGRSADVDAAVLSARVRIALGDERTQHGAVDRPGPGGRTRSQHERSDQCADDSVACSVNHAARLQRRPIVVKSDYSEER